MKFTREEALKYHHQMWSDMQRDIGDTDNANERTHYKAEWCEKHFPNEEIANYCFCCEYNDQIDVWGCYHCPIAWPTDYDGEPNCCKSVHSSAGWESPYYLVTPISEILALPEREVEDGTDT